MISDPSGKPDQETSETASDTGQRLESGNPLSKTAPYSPQGADPHPAENHRAGSGSTSQPVSASGGSVPFDLEHVGDLQRPFDLERVGDLQRLVREQVVPRLIAGHDGAGRAVRLSPQFEGFVADNAPEPAMSVQELAMASIKADYPRVEALLREDQRRGRNVDQLILDDLTKAACFLGQLWVDDKISFFETTCGTATLQYFVRKLATDTAEADVNNYSPARILLTTVPGEQHVMGLSVLEHFFLKAGWEVVYEPTPSRQALISLVHDKMFDVIGLTLSDPQLQSTAQQILKNLKSESSNRAVSVLVGGYVFKSNPEAVTAVGADDWAEDAPLAVRKAEALAAASPVHPIMGFSRAGRAVPKRAP